MKKAFILLSIFKSFNLWGACPEFHPTYSQCFSTRGSAIDSISTKMRPPFYSFTLTRGQHRKRYTVVTDGEPRDITIQTQNGSEATYSERAYCLEGKLITVRTREDVEEIDEKVYESEDGILKIHHSVNGSSYDSISCHAH